MVEKVEERARIRRNDKNREFTYYFDEKLKRVCYVPFISNNQKCNEGSAFV